MSLRSGTYTATLNEYGREGWELVSVTSDVAEPPAPEKGSGIPVPRAIGRLEDAAAKINKLGRSESEAGEKETSALLWVLRRPLVDPDSKLD